MQELILCCFIIFLGNEYSCRLSTSIFRFLFLIYIATMSSQPEFTSHEMSGKLQSQASLREVPGLFDVDGCDDGSFDDSVNSSRKGFTKNDRKDMKRMGKRQELMVRYPADPVGVLALSLS